MATYFEPMVNAATGSASHLLNSKQQMMMLDQSKTVTECALQLIYAAKEAGGNPKVKVAIHEFQKDKFNRSNSAVNFFFPRLFTYTPIWTSLPKP